VRWGASACCVEFWVQELRLSHEEVPPPLFLHLRILKGLQERFLELRILKDLHVDNFCQNRAKRGICPELRILKEL
jgi:hypothetical protein